MWLKGIHKINNNKKATDFIIIIIFLNDIVYIFGTLKISPYPKETDLTDD